MISSEHSEIGLVAELRTGVPVGEIIRSVVIVIF